MCYVKMYFPRDVNPTSFIWYEFPCQPGEFLCFFHVHILFSASSANELNKVKALDAFYINMIRGLEPKLKGNLCSFIQKWVFWERTETNRLSMVLKCACLQVCVFKSVCVCVCTLSKWPQCLHSVSRGSNIAEMRSGERFSPFVACSPSSRADQITRHCLEYGVWQWGSVWLFRGRPLSCLWI